jgi:multicomponent Na+:H+ antiporter subunit E
MRYGGLVAMNLLLVLVWGTIQNTRSLLGYAIGFILGFLVLSLGDREYARRTWAVISYAGFLVWQIILSSIPVTLAILNPRDVTKPGIVAVPLRASTPAEVLLLASSITLTPGTISVETGSGPDGTRVLFVHALFAGDPDGMRREIRDEFEARILRFMRGKEAYDGRTRG